MLKSEEQALNEVIKRLKEKGVDSLDREVAILESLLPEKPKEYHCSKCKAFLGTHYTTPERYKDLVCFDCQFLSKNSYEKGRGALEMIKHLIEHTQTEQVEISYAYLLVDTMLSNPDLIHEEFFAYVEKDFDKGCGV